MTSGLIRAVTVLIRAVRGPKEWPMCVLSQVLPRRIQDLLLSCCDSAGVVVDDERLVDVIAEHSPDLLTPRWADKLVDLVCELWQERRQQKAAAASN